MCLREIFKEAIALLSFGSSGIIFAFKQNQIQLNATTSITSEKQT